MSYAQFEGWRRDNPARNAILAKYTSVPHETWSPDDVVAFRTRWPSGSPERQAFEVIFWTGARCVDATGLGWQNVHDGVLEYVQAKTGGVAYVPITASVAAFLEADRRWFMENASDDLLFILSSTGNGRSVKSLCQFVSKAARKAGLERKTAHGLRKARAIILAENGWTPYQIGTWTGHDSLQEVAHYTRDANKRAMVLETQVGNSTKPKSQIIEIRG